MDLDLSGRSDMMICLNDGASKIESLTLDFLNRARAYVPMLVVDFPDADKML